MNCFKIILCKLVAVARSRIPTKRECAYINKANNRGCDQHELLFLEPDAAQS